MADGHLDDAAWERLAANEASDLERDRYFDHVTACAECTLVWRGILTLKSEAEAQGLIAPGSRERSWWRAQMVPLAMAAALILVVGGVFLSRRPASDVSTVRSADQLPAIDGLMMAYNPEFVPTFVWPPVMSATLYRVEVFLEDGRPVWSREQTAPPMPWPSDVATAKGAYRWRVEALKGGAVIARSRLAPMELTR